MDSAVLKIKSLEQEVADLKAELKAVKSALSIADSVPSFSADATRKLDDLITNGYVVTGYCFERLINPPTPSRGLIDFTGYVKIVS